MLERLVGQFGDIGRQCMFHRAHLVDALGRGFKPTVGLDAEGLTQWGLDGQPL
ncbi:hypothetical protein D3C84_1301980 [compost metagenome]